MTLEKIYEQTKDVVNNISDMSVSDKMLVFTTLNNILNRQLVSMFESIDYSNGTVQFCFRNLPDCNITVYCDLPEEFTSEINTFPNSTTVLVRGISQYIWVKLDQKEVKKYLILVCRCKKISKKNVTNFKCQFFELVREMLMRMNGGSLKRLSDAVYAYPPNTVMTKSARTFLKDMEDSINNG